MADAMAGVADDRERALEILRAWHGERAWARRDPERLEIARVRAVGPTQVMLQSVVEGRVLFGSSLVDPWSLEIAIAPGATQASLELDEPPAERTCEACIGRRRVACERCDGTGILQSQDRSCPDCDGAGRHGCGRCRGQGRVVAPSIVVVRRWRRESLRVLTDQSLPAIVREDLHRSLQTGSLVHRQRGENVERLLAAASYRDQEEPDSPVLRAVRELCAEPLGAEARVVEQELSVGRVECFDVELGNGSHLWIWGDPPTLYPAWLLSSWSGRAVRAAPVLVSTAVTITIALVYLLSLTR